MKRGLFIVLEGTDGCGKSTQIRNIKTYLRDKGIHTMLVREPGGTDIGEKVRKLVLDSENAEMKPSTEMYLYAASRAQLVQQVIKPAINEGKVVICDRFVYSSLVYQGVGRKLGIDTVWEVNKNALEGMMPDIAIFLDLPIEKALDRIKRGSMDRIEQESTRFHNTVYSSYLKLCSDDKFNLKRIDADREIKEVFADIKDIVDTNLSKVGYYA